MPDEIAIKNSQENKYKELARDIKKLPEEKQIKLVYEFCCHEFTIKHGFDYELRKKDIKYENKWKIYDSMFKEVLSEVLRNFTQYM